MMIKPAINNIAHLEGGGKPPLEKEEAFLNRFMRCSGYLKTT